MDKTCPACKAALEATGSGPYFADEENREERDAGDYFCANCCTYWWQRREGHLSISARNANRGRACRHQRAVATKEAAS